MKNSLGAVQTVLVLGGDSDIAFATLTRLIRGRTRTIILAGRNIERLEARARDLRELGATTVNVLRFDLGDFESHTAFVEQVFSEHEDIDLVFLTAGALGDQKLDEVDRERALQIIETNYTGPVSVLIPVIAKMKSQGHGTLAVMSTVAAERPRRSNFIYGSSKAGIDWFAQGMGDALRGSGVDVLVVRPGFVKSRMTSHLSDAPLAATPEEVADAVVEGLRCRHEIVWVPGKIRWVMSVLRHLPRSIFRRLNL